MSAPFYARPPVGSLDELRVYAAECFALAKVYSDHAEDLVLIGDDEGLRRTTAKLIATITAAAATVTDIRGRTCGS